MYYKNNNIDICIQKIEHNRIGASQEVEFTKQKLFEQYFTPLDIGILLRFVTYCE